MGKLVLGKMALGKMALGKMAGWVKWRRVKWHWVKWNWVNCHVTYLSMPILWHSKLIGTMRVDAISNASSSHTGAFCRGIKIY